MWRKTKDGSIEDSSGRVIFFSTERFANDIGLGNCCFICGARPDQKKFDDEHVLPKWVLRRYGLFDKTIKLPNDETITYGRYTVPCCEDCNRAMGAHFETPISEAVKRGGESLSDLMRSDPLRVYAWIALIYFKTHLKDRAMRVHLDRRKGDEMIADSYDWTEMHHVHCLVRYFYNNASVAPEAIGSFVMMDTDNSGSKEVFDYGDLYAARTAMVTLDGKVMFAVMNDSGAVFSNYHQRLEKVTGPLSHVQAREVMVEMACLNLHVKERALFQTDCDMLNERCRIVARRPSAPELEPIDPAVRGEMLIYSLRHVLPRMKVRGFDSQEQAQEAIRSGRLSFLFGDDGKFISESFERA